MTITGKVEENPVSYGGYVVYVITTKEGHRLVISEKCQGTKDYIFVGKGQDITVDGQILPDYPEVILSEKSRIEIKNRNRTGQDEMV